jgi:hypothetical protein
MLKQLINLFIKTNGRKPNSLEMLQLKFKAAQQSGKGQILRPEFGKKKPWYKDKPPTGKKAEVTELDDPLIDEFARTETLASPTRIKQGFSTQSKLNNWSSNQQWVKDFIGRKNKEFNSLSKADQKEVLEMFETQIKKHMPKEPKAYGGLAGMLGERTGFETGGDTTEKSWINIVPQYDEHGNLIPIFSKTGDQQIRGAPEGITADKEFTNFVMSLDIPIDEKISLLGDLTYVKGREKREYKGHEIGLGEGGGKSRKIGIGYNEGQDPETGYYTGDGFGGHVKLDVDSGKPETWIKWSKSFAKGGIANHFRKK